MGEQSSLDSLAPGAGCGSDAAPAKRSGGGGGSPAWAVVWFIIIAIIVWLIIVGSCPEFVQRKDDCGKPTGEVDQGLAVLWAVIISIILCIIIWIIIWLFRGAR